MHGDGQIIVNQTLEGRILKGLADEYGVCAKRQLHLARRRAGEREAGTCGTSAQTVQLASRHTKT